MQFDPYNRALKIRESMGSLIHKIGVHLGVCDFIPSLSYILGSMKCDSWVSLLICTFASPYFGQAQG
jgi:hypothetical protein